MMAASLPAELTVAIDHGHIVGATARYCDAELRGISSSSENSSAIEMTTMQVHFLGLECPTMRAVGVQNTESGNDLIATILIEVNRPRLVCRAMTARVHDVPE